MATFNFYQDVKCTVWGRNRFEIEAETQEEAEAIAKEYFDEDIADVDDERVSFIDWELNEDTLEDILPSENGDNPTLEIYNSDRKLIANNFH